MGTAAGGLGAARGLSRSSAGGLRALIGALKGCGEVGERLDPASRAGGRRGSSLWLSGPARPGKSTSSILTEPMS